MWFSFGLLLASMMSAPTTENESKVFSQVGGWVVFQDLKSDDCGTIMTYADGSTLSWHWRPRNETSYFFYTDKAMSSIEQDKKYEVRILFIGSRPGSLDDGWGTRTAIGSRTDEDVPQIMFQLKGDEAVTDIATNSLIAIKYKDKLVASLSLDGSANVVREMRKCAVGILKNHPADPFED